MTRLLYYVADSIIRHFRKRPPLVRIGDEVQIDVFGSARVLRLDSFTTGPFSATAEFRTDQVGWFV